MTVSAARLVDRSSGPAASYAAHRAEVDQAIRRVLDSGRYIVGDEVAGFEREFAAYIGVGHAVGTGSGTEALHLGLRACGVGPGDVVVTVSHTAVATVAAIELTGARPVLVDIDARHFTIDPDRLAATVEASARAGSRGGRIKAVIPVHLYGQPADMPAVAEIARRHELYVLEDCAQAHGAAIEECRVGRWGHLAAFSFYPTKNLGALGDAGALLTDDEALATRARLLREYGWRQRYVSEIRGFNSRLDEIQAAVLRVKLPHLDDENERRRELARRYDVALASAPVVPPFVRPRALHVYHQYVVRSGRRDALQAFLAARGVPSQVHYPLPVHLQPAYRGRVVIGEGGLANTERVCREILSLPIGAHMPPSEVDAITAVVGSGPGADDA